MDGISAQMYVPLGAITAAVIAGLFSYLSLILSKEQKLSEFRQNWIDGLRDDLSSFIAAVYSMEYLNGVYMSREGEDPDYVDLATAIREPHRKAAIAFYHIMLRFNPNDNSTSQRELINILQDVRQAFLDAEYTKATDRFPELREKAQLVLKAEWERVKSGEPAYWWSTRITLLVLVGALAIGAFLSVKSMTRPTGEPAAHGPLSTLTTDGKEPSSSKGVEPGAAGSRPAGGR
jgi:hypothetical protein